MRIIKLTTLIWREIFIKCGNVKNFPRLFLLFLGYVCVCVWMKNIIEAKVWGRREKINLKLNESFSYGFVN